MALIRTDKAKEKMDNSYLVGFSTTLGNTGAHGSPYSMIILEKSKLAEYYTEVTASNVSLDSAITRTSFYAVAFDVTNHVEVGARVTLTANTAVDISSLFSASADHIALILEPEYTGSSRHYGVCKFELS